MDNQIDKVQLAQALSCFGRSNEKTPPYLPVLVSRGDVLDEIERYLEIHPEITARRHHARVDAEALRSAFMEVLD